MKILILATRYFGLGGLERHTRLFAKAVIDMVGPANVGIWSLYAGDVTDGIGEECYLGAAGATSGLWVKVKFTWWSFWAARHYDMVVAGHIALAPIARWLHRLYRLPYVVMVYGIEVWGVLARSQALALREATRVVALSRFTADRLTTQHRVSPDHVIVIEPVVDPRLLAAARQAQAVTADERHKVLLTVARLAAVEQYKGCDTVIQVLPHLAAEVGPLKYIVVGDGDDRPRLEALAEAVGAAPMVRFVGRVSDQALAHYYATCHVFVMPSRVGRRGGRWTGEGFGLVYIEAAAFGKPAVAGSGDGSAEAVQDGVTGLVVDAHDRDAVADALRRLLADPVLRSRMGQAARARVERYFTYPRLHQQVEGVIAGLRADAGR